MEPSASRSEQTPLTVPTGDTCACGLSSGPGDAPAAPSVTVRRVCLTQMRVGDTGRVCGGDLDADDRDMLRALGLRPDARVRLTRTGEPCIVQVLGRHGCSCRVGLARPLAQRMLIAIDSNGSGR